MRGWRIAIGCPARGIIPFRSISNNFTLVGLEPAIHEAASPPAVPVWRGCRACTGRGLCRRAPWMTGSSPVKVHLWLWLWFGVVLVVAVRALLSGL
jgi:hypothetical protein